MQIVTRAQWGAQDTDGFGPAPLPREWWLHHSAGLLPDVAWIDTNHDGVDDDEERIVRELEAVGQQRFGGGISYNWLVSPSGRAYVGVSMDREGAHTLGHNSAGRGICLMGNYSLNRPTSAQLDTVALIMVTEWRAGRAKTFVLNGGHRDLGQTECPGDHAYALIPEINRRATALATGHPLTRKAPRMLTFVLPATEAPADLSSDPSTWPRSREICRPLLPPQADNWRGEGSISSIVVGWAVDAAGKAQVPGKLSGFIEYLRIFYHSAGGPGGYRDLLSKTPLTNVALMGNWSVPALTLPYWATAFVVRYAAPSELSVAVEYQH